MRRYRRQTVWAISFCRTLIGAPAPAWFTTPPHWGITQVRRGPAATPFFGYSSRATKS